MKKLLKIAISRDRTRATIHFNTHSVNLSHDKGRVIDLLWIIFPEWVDVWETTMDKTDPCIDLNQQDDAA